MAGVSGAGLPRDGRLLMRAGLLLGTSPAFKLTNLPALPAIVLTVCLVVPWLPASKVPMSGIRVGGTSLRGMGLWGRLVETAWVAAVVGMCALVALSPWLLKNVAFFGQPLYPVGVGVSSAVQSVGTGGTAGATAAPAAHADHLARLWWVLTNAVIFFRHFITPLSIVLVAAPFVLRGAAARTALVFLAVAIIVYLLFVPPYTPRYYLGIVALGEALTAATMYAVVDRLRPARRGDDVRGAASADSGPMAAQGGPAHDGQGWIGMRALEGALGLYLLGSSLLVVGTGVGLLTLHGEIDVALGSRSADAYLAATVRPYAALRWVNEHTPESATIGMAGVTRGGYLDRSYLPEWYDNVRNALTAGSTRDGVLRSWCRAGVRYAVLDRGDDQYDDLAQAGVRPAASFAWLRQPGLAARVLFSSRGVDVLRVTPCVAAGDLR